MKHIRTILALFLLGILLLHSSVVIVYATEAEEESKVPSGIRYTDIPATIENYVEEHTETMAGSNRQANLRLVRKINSCENMNDKSCRRLYSFVYNEKDWRDSYEKLYQNIKTGTELSPVVKAG